MPHLLDSVRVQHHLLFQDQVVGCRSHGLGVTMGKLVWLCQMQVGWTDQPEKHGTELSWRPDFQTGNEKDPGTLKLKRISGETAGSVMDTLYLRDTRGAFLRMEGFLLFHSSF